MMLFKGCETLRTEILSAGVDKSPAGKVPAGIPLVKVCNACHLQGQARDAGECTAGRVHRSLVRTGRTQAPGEGTCGPGNMGPEGGILTFSRIVTCLHVYVIALCEPNKRFLEANAIPGLRVCRLWFKESPSPQPGSLALGISTACDPEPGNQAPAGEDTLGCGEKS